MTPGIALQYADGRCDGFLQTAKVGDRFPIGYYREDELPIMSALAKNYTTFDNYFCSMMGADLETRLFSSSAPRRSSTRIGDDRSSSRTRSSIASAMRD